MPRLAHTPGMRALAGLVIASLSFGPAFAEPSAKPSKTPTRPVAKPAEPAAPTPVCKKVFVGKGLERHAVCEFTAPIVVKETSAKPNVLIVPHGGRSVTGRPRSEDRLSGLSHHLNE